MFEIGTADVLWKIAKKYPSFSNRPYTLKPLGYSHIVNLVEAFNLKKILEFGHGSGSFMFSIFKKNIEIWGLDDLLDDSQVDPKDLLFIKNLHPEVKFVTGLMGSGIKELPKNYFDLVYSVSVLEHIPHENLNSVFEECFKILKPGGIFAHSYDIYFGQDTKPVFDAIENSGFQWLKSKESMNVIWEEWLNIKDEKLANRLLKNIVFENPMFVAEYYMWQIKRELRGCPPNYVTILIAGRKPLLKSSVSKLQDLNAIKSEVVPEDFISFENLKYFGYSRNSHFELFEKSGNIKDLFKYNVESDNCDIKVYQDLLIYSYIKQNLKPGSKILDVGGGNSRILKYFKDIHECWNIDLLDKSGKQEDGVTYVNDHLGNFNKDLPDNFFDMVFSISTFVHQPNTNEELYENILKDNNRILKAGGITIHCLTSIFKNTELSFSNIAKYFIENQKSVVKKIHDFELTLDPDIYFMSEKFYNNTWKNTLKKDYDDFGKPLSFNFIWKK